MNVPVRQRRLGNELRRLRERAKIAGPQVGSALDISKSMLSRIETGSRVPTETSLTALLDLYGVSDATERAGALRLWQEARRNDWLAGYADIFSAPFRDYLTLEPEAELIQNYQPQYVPGLLQTVQYIRAMVSAGHDDAGMIDRIVSIRIQRQQVLLRELPPRFEAVIDESALRRPIGGRAVLREQLLNLVELAGRPNVQVRLLPYDSEVFAGGPFSILRLRDPGSLLAVFLENLAAETFLGTEGDIRAHGVAFERLQKAALSPGESVQRIRRAAEVPGADD